jgi:uncharacterized protein (TIGR00251 family)
MLVLEIKVTPNAGRQGCSLDKSGILKCALKSPAERNKANEELIVFLANTLDIGRDRITLLSGHTSRKKRLRINAEISYESVLSALGITSGKQLRLDK